jgi:hypothetical protein
MSAIRASRRLNPIYADQWLMKRKNGKNAAKSVQFASNDVFLPDDTHALFNLFSNLSSSIFAAQ